MTLSSALCEHERTLPVIVTHAALAFFLGAFALHFGEQYLGGGLLGFALNAFPQTQRYFCTVLGFFANQEIGLFCIPVMPPRRAQATQFPVLVSGAPQ